jgi:hypothetical protein
MGLEKKKDPLKEVLLMQLKCLRDQAAAAASG